jgi:hypothetical protein
MTRQEIEQYDTEKGDYHIVVSFCRFKEIFEAVTGVKLITEAPKPSIQEQLKDVRTGDFIVFNAETNSKNKIKTLKVIFVICDYEYFYYMHVGECTIYKCKLEQIKEIISIQHNNFEKFINKGENQ